MCPGQLRRGCRLAGCQSDLLIAKSDGAAGTRAENAAGSASPICVYVLSKIMLQMGVLTAELAKLEALPMKRASGQSCEWHGPQPPHQGAHLPHALFLHPVGCAKHASQETCTPQFARKSCKCSSVRTLQHTPGRLSCMRWTLVGRNNDLLRASPRARVSLTGTPVSTDRGNSKTSAFMNVFLCFGHVSKVPCHHGTLPPSTVFSSRVPVLINAFMAASIKRINSSK